MAHNNGGVRLSPTDTAADAFQLIAADCRDHLLTNVSPVVDSGDVEGIHQMRVGIRRLDSTMAAFRDTVEWPSERPLRKELKWIRQTLGTARDVDVFALETLPEIKQAGDANGAIDDLMYTVEELRETRHKVVVEALQSARFALIADTLDQWIDSASWREPRDHRRRNRLEKPIHKLSRKALDRLDKAAWSRGHDLSKMTMAERHRTRLRLKKLRYVSEGFKSLYDPKETRRYLRRLKKVQDQLGAMNDAVTAQSVLRQATLDYPEIIRAPGLRLLEQWQEAKTRRLIKAGSNACRALSDLTPFWRSGG